MARAELNKAYRTFVKGLITEASPLTYPADSSYDELNTVLSRKGNRTRRLGQTYAGQAFDASTVVADILEAQQEFVWKAVANVADTNFLTLQNGNTVTFYDLNGDTPLSNKKAFTVNLASYLRPGTNSTECARDQVQFAHGRGYLFIVSDKIEPLVVQYHKETDTITVTSLILLVRDFDGLNDSLQNDEEPSVLSKEHHYNLQNQGWVNGNVSSSTFSPVTFDGYVYNPEVYSTNGFDYTGLTAYQNSTTDSPIFKYQTAIGRFPGNNKQWWVARAEADDPDKGLKAGDFLPDVLNRLFSGNNRAPRGHYILNAFRKDRSAVSGISGIATEELDYRPNSVTFFSGRAWFGAGSTVYFSQILDSTGSLKAGLCHQEADPTAEDISDLTQADGGVVPIPEIDKIVRLLPMANGVMVFAMNGVWFISGGDSAFSATNISISKVSPIGTKFPQSILEVDNNILWWSETGIQALAQASGQFGPIPGKFGNTSISEQTVQTFYDEIPDDSKLTVKVVYDTRNNVVMWLYKDDDVNLTGPYQYNKVLLLDMTLQAFYPWKFSMFETGPRITGAFLDVGFSSTDDTQNVVAGADLVQALSAGQVTVNTEIRTVRPSNIYYLVDVPSSGRTTSQTVEATCADWVEYDDVGLGYESYIETGYELNEDTMRSKQMTYVVSHFTQNSNSACTLRVKWEWAIHAHSNKWSSPVEAYRPRLGLDETQFQVVTSKNKVRGSGKAIQFRYGTDLIGKNFDLLGWSVAFSGATRV